MNNIRNFISYTLNNVYPFKVKLVENPISSHTYFDSVSENISCMIQEDKMTVYNALLEALSNEFGIKNIDKDLFNHCVRLIEEFVLIEHKI